MTIVVTGGGSGGHITPILAVASELKRLQPAVKIVYIGQRGDAFLQVIQRNESIDDVFAVSAGKFRRYHGEGLKQLLDLKTILLNVRDASRVLRGVIQSRALLKKLQPEAVFSRGGYVSVPVCVAAGRLGVPYITHDSDAVPSLANRLIAKKAVKNAVALPKELYPYDQSKTVTVGVPVRAVFDRVDPKKQLLFKQDLQLKVSDKVLFVIGGGLGAATINTALLACVKDLLNEVENLHIYHVAGDAHQESMHKKYSEMLDQDVAMQRVHVFGYIDDVYKYSGAADVVLTRAGASSLADFAVQGKACVVVPSPFLTGGHQLKNAKVLEDAGAIVNLQEATLKERPESLKNALIELLNNAQHRDALSERFTDFGNVHAAKDLAELVIEVAGVSK